MAQFGEPGYPGGQAPNHIVLALHIYMYLAVPLEVLPAIF